MQDIFLKSSSKETLIEDLKVLNKAFVSEEGELIQASHNFALDYIGVLAIPGTGKWEDEKEIEPVQFYDGIHCNLRVFNEFETIFSNFTSENTQVLKPTTPCRMFA